MEVQESKKLSQYSSMQKLLLVGEGDFSFSLSLAKAFSSATKITAASLDVRGNAKSLSIFYYSCMFIYYNNLDHHKKIQLACQISFLFFVKLVFLISVLY